MECITENTGTFCLPVRRSVPVDGPTSDDELVEQHTIAPDAALGNQPPDVEAPCINMIKLRDNPQKMDNK